MPFINKRMPFYVSITALMVFVILILGGIFLSVINRESKMAAVQMADHLFTTTNAKTLQMYESSLESVVGLVDTAVNIQGMAVVPGSDGMSHPAVMVMLKALSHYDFLFSTYCGYEDGSFIQVIAVRNQQNLHEIYSAPAGTFFVLRTIARDESGTKQQRWRFFDIDHRIIGETGNIDAGYDPRRRPWYIRAGKEAGAFFTSPYVFSSSKLPGITCAEKLVYGNGVFGADITLDMFTRSLKQQQVSKNAALFVFARDGSIILSSGQNPVKKTADNKLTFLKGFNADDLKIRAVVSDYQKDAGAAANRTREILIRDTPCLVLSTPIKKELKIDQIISVVSPVSDFTSHIRHMEKQILEYSLMMLLITVPLAFLLARGVSASLMRLEREAEKMQQSDFSDSEHYDSSVKEIHSLVEAFRGMKSKIRVLMNQQHRLFDDFTKLIAGAIDAKSPYTAGHCARVPVIAQMLVEQACKCKSGVFADFQMDRPDQRWEFEIAAWLHDCGKVTTPEYVVDKATKLETIYNRIHEVRMRFEVLIRDARITYYRKRLANEVDLQELEAELEAAEKKITDDFSFVAQCNIGGEFMADEMIERLQQIAEQTWVRHLDDRLGLSWTEENLKKQGPEQDLPAVEHVLADKAEHFIAWRRKDPFEKDKHGFKMTVPNLRYNRGEIHNLCIRRGTLTEEERFKVNEHIIQTVNMLDNLEFPDYLANVPEFACAHHETMIGTGYPCKLKKEEMSVPARIMIIADIFEALTAADRPYKSAKSLSEAIKIMSFMRDDQHIDHELFDLFLSSGVYLEYAKAYLMPNQMDEVDVDQYLSTTAKKDSHCP